MDIPPIREAMQWHLSNNNDPAIRWIVERLRVGAAMELAQDGTANVVQLKREHPDIAVQFQNDAANGPARS